MALESNQFAHVLDPIPVVIHGAPYIRISVYTNGVAFPRVWAPSCFILCEAIASYYLTVAMTDRVLPT